MLPRVIGEKKKFVLNFAAQIAVLGSQFIISFVLTPIVLQKLGDEAYGFVGLVNNFVSYVAIVTAALNAMASRFITVSYHEGKSDDTEEYFSSVFFSNCIMAAAVLVGSVFLAANIDRLVSVAPEFVYDLRITVLLAFLNAGVSLLTVVFGVAAFIKNELFLNSIGQLLGSVLRVIFLFVLFWAVSPHMWYFSVAGLVATISTGVVQIILTRRLLPELRLSPSRFNFQKVLKLLRVGVWNSLQNINNLIQTGLDLLIANIFAGGAAMGLLSIAKTVPQALTSLSGSIANLFYPKMAEAYAQGNKVELVNRFDFAMRFTAAFLIVPLAGFIGFGPSFYSLWLPGRTAAELSEIQLLSVLTVVTLIASALVEPLYYANTLTTEVKGSVLIAFGFSLLTLAIEFPLILFTSLDRLVVIAGVSSILMFVRHSLVQPFYCAVVIGVRKRTFFKPLIREIVVLVVLWLGYAFVDQIGICTTWASLVGIALPAAFLGYIFEMYALFGKEERMIIFALLRHKLGLRRINAG